MSKQHCRSNRQLCCFDSVAVLGNNVRLCRKDEISTQNSFDIAAVFGNKVERCFDIVAGVDRALPDYGWLTVTSCYQPLDVDRPAGLAVDPVA